MFLGHWTSLQKEHSLHGNRYIGSIILDFIRLNGLHGSASSIYAYE